MLKFAQLTGEAPKLRLMSRRRVVRHQPGQAGVTELTEVTGAVEGMKAGVHELRGIPDIVEVGGCHEMIAITGGTAAPTRLAWSTTDSV